MQVKQEQVEPCQVSLTIEVESAKVGHAFERAYREYAKYVNVPGFRKGKAPLQFVRQRVPESEVRQRTAELLVEPAYEEALKETRVSPFAAPKLELVQLEMNDSPFIFKAIVPLAPTVELGAYTGLKAERYLRVVADDEVDAQIERMRARAADSKEVDRPVQLGDWVIAELSAAIEDKPELAEAKKTMIDIGGDNVEGFDDQVIGLVKGEMKTFELTYPEDFADQDLAGKHAEFTITVDTVNEKIVPELTDSFVADLTREKYETVDAWKAGLRAEMEKAYNDEADRAVNSSLVEQAVKNSTVSFPPTMVEEEVEEDAGSLMKALAREEITLDQYLEQIHKSREELTADFASAAERRVRTGLVLREIATKENLAFTDADLDAAIAARAEERGTSPAGMRAMLEAANGISTLRNQTQTKKILDFLRASAIIEEKDASAGAADQTVESE